MAEPFTASGTIVSIGPAVTAEPANAAAYAALTPWTAITKIETLGEIGDEATLVTIDLLGDERTRKAKGSRDAGTLTITVAYDAQDTGQTALETAEASKSNYPIKIELPNKLTGPGTNEIWYVMGLVSSRRANVGGNNNIVRRTFNIALNSKITRVAPT